MSDLAWWRWHSEYDDLSSPRSARLEAVQELLTAALDAAALGSGRNTSSAELRLISICAGQGREVLPVLLTHPRGGDVSALMVEFDPLNAGFLTSALGATSLAGVDVAVADAGETSSYAAGVPADIVVCSGVFEHLSAPQVRGLVRGIPLLCAVGASLVWAIDHTPPGLVDTLGECLAEGGFAAQEQKAKGEWMAGYAVLRGDPPGYRPGLRWFDAIACPDSEAGGREDARRAF